MLAVTYSQFGGPEVLELNEAPMPTPGPDQLLVRVKATALNRADLLQRQGKYSPPSGESNILGLEIAGEVTALGSNVTDFQIGQRVFGLVGSGAYAQYCVIDQGCAMLIPETYSFEEAAAVPEAFLTANEAIFGLGNLQPREAILIHAGASGVGTAGIQLAHQSNTTVYVTVGSPEKKAKVLKLGVNDAIEYKKHDFVIELKKITGEQGVDVVIDFVGASYLMHNLQILKYRGRLVCVGLMGGRKGEVDLDTVLTQRIQIKGLTMRKSPLHEKRMMTKDFSTRWMSALADRTIHPVIDSVFPLDKVQEAHRYMEENKNVGKIVLKVEE